MIHATAIIDSEARIDASVQIGPYAIVEGPVTIGAQCALAAHAKLIGPLVLGRGNRVHSFAVLGDAPQDAKYRDQPSRLLIGDDNIFREHATVHRGTNGDTIIGAHNFFMVGSHVGHNCRVGNNVTLVNHATLGGYVEVQDRVIIGGHCAVHQFCRVGRLAMISNNSAHNVDIPPFVTAMLTNTITQLNAVGIRRSGMGPQGIHALRRMFQTLFRTHGDVPLGRSIDLLPDELRRTPEVEEFIEFVRTTKRGVARFRPWSMRQGAMEPGNPDSSRDAGD
jgi:UDP-N-acetylglucosamine acyltransferase